MAECRAKEYIRFDKFLKGRVAPSVVQSIQTGMRSIRVPVDLADYTREFLSDSRLQTAMVDQGLIGWKHFLYGRISTKWKEVELIPEYKKTPSDWAAELVRKLLNMGMILWRQRNTLFHGNDGEISKLEITKVQTIIQMIYTDIAPLSKPEHRWLFATPLNVRITEHYALHITWIDSVRRLYRTQYKELVTQVGNQTLFDQELEYLKSHRGHTGFQ